MSSIIQQSLRQIPLFEDLEPYELEWITQISSKRDYKRKSILFVEGSEIEAVYFLVNGLVKTYKTDMNGNEHIVSLLGEGSMFPHIGFFLPYPYPATAETLVDTRLIVMPVKQFEKLLLEKPQLSVKLLRVMGQKLKDLQDRLQELSGSDMQARALSFLKELIENHGVAASGGIFEVPFPLTHQEIANSIGTARETVSRLFTQLKKEGVLDTSKEGHILIERDALYRKLEER
ncbi:Crp/Fnr family transcriptional regulator [Paenibacillus turpanensis]|uniref:Crp/Fnr family transcriptional regulator n=1 Tax=Paenibacillus turpanensis TaxID=2689078 RepID=UPI001408E777|nr:Crp/Fnr family transcriptional regulator [Paenibacillus turpanensis]